MEVELEVVEDAVDVDEEGHEEAGSNGGREVVDDVLDSGGEEAVGDAVVAAPSVNVNCEVDVEVEVEIGELDVELELDVVVLVAAEVVLDVVVVVVLLVAGALELDVVVVVVAGALELDVVVIVVDVVAGPVTVVAARGGGQFFVATVLWADATGMSASVCSAITAAIVVTATVGFLLLSALAEPLRADDWPFAI